MIVPFIQNTHFVVYQNKVLGFRLHSKLLQWHKRSSKPANSSLISNKSKKGTPGS